MAERHYEYIVVGKGLMGVAAARHLSAHSPGVALIGPDEPPDRSAYTGVFGSHYDEGRITRILDPDRIWALLAQRSIARYRANECSPQQAAGSIHSFDAAQDTLVGIELMHMIKKRRMVVEAGDEGLTAAELCYSLAV